MNVDLPLSALTDRELSSLIDACARNMDVTAPGSFFLALVDALKAERHRRAALDRSAAEQAMSDVDPIGAIWLPLSDSDGIID